MSIRTSLLGGAVLLAVLGLAGDLAQRGWAAAVIALATCCMALAVVASVDRRPDRRTLLRWLAAGYLTWAAVRLVGGLFNGVPDGPRRAAADILTFGWVHRGTPDSGWARAIPVALAVVALVPPVPALVRLRRAGSAADGALAVAFGAALLWVPAAVDLLARQYDERLSQVDGHRVYVGPLTPVVLWSTLFAAALGVLTAAALRPLLVRWRLVRRASLPFAAWIVGIASLALVWRLTELLTIAPARTDGGDPLYYHTQANTIARGLGFIEPLNWIASGARIPTALHGPGYPLYLSAFSRIGASTWFDHRLASGLIGTGTVVLAMLITRRLGGNLAAVLAGLAACFYPHLWTIDGVLFPEGLFIFCCGVAMLAAYRWYDHRRWPAALVTGVAIGFAALSRGEGIFLVVLLAAPLCWFAVGMARRRKLAAFAVMFAGTLAVVGPWMVRNATTFEDFVPLSTNGNELHVYSNCDDTYRGPLLGFWSYECQTRLRDTDGDGLSDFDPPGDESQQKRYWQDVGFDYARDHAGEVPKVVAARVLRQWDLFRPWQNAELAFIEGRSPQWARAGLFAYYALAIGAAFGVRRLWRGDRRLLIPVAAQFATVTLTAAYAYGTTRFRAPAELALCILAAVGVAPLARRLLSVARRPLGRQRPLTTAVPILSRLERLGWTLPYAPAVAMIVLAARGMFLHPGAAMEEGFMLVFPERVLEGDVPHVDFLHLYGPASLHLLAGVYAVFGVSLEVARAVGLVYLMATVLAVITLARPWGRLIASAAGVVAVLVVFTANGLTPLAWNGGVALALWSVVLVLRGGRWATVAAAFLAGLAVSFRPDLAVTLGLAHGVRWWLDRRRVDGRPTIRSAIRFEVVGAFVLGCASLIVLFAQAGLRAPIRGMVLEPVFELRPGRELPRPPSWDHVDGMLQLIAETPAPAWPFPALAASQQLVVWFFALLLVDLAMLATAVRWWRRPIEGDRRRARVLLVVAAANLGLLLQAMQRPDSTHLQWGSVLAWPMAACWLAEWRRRTAGPDSPMARLATAVVPLMALLVVLPFPTSRTYAMHVRQTLGPNLGGLPPGLVARHGDRTFRFGDVAPWAATQEVVDDLAALSRPGERLLVGPVDLRATPYDDAYFYHLFPDLPPATRFIEMDPGLANAADSPLADELASAEWLILTRSWSAWVEPNTSQEYLSDAPNQVVEQQFCLVGSYQHDRARLYRRCPGGGAPGPYAGPYEPEFDYAVIFGVDVPARPDGTSPQHPGAP